MTFLQYDGQIPRMESGTRLNNIQEEMTALLSAMRGGGGRCITIYQLNQLMKIYFSTLGYITDGLVIKVSSTIS